MHPACIRDRTFLGEQPGVIPRGDGILHPASQGTALAPRLAEFHHLPVDQERIDNIGLDILWHLRVIVFWLVLDPTASTRAESCAHPPDVTESMLLSELLSNVGHCLFS